MDFILNSHNKKLIDIIFPNLLSEHKQLIVDSLNKIFDVLLKTIFKNNKNNFINQMKLNDSRDILGFITLLLPYFDFSSKEITIKIKSLDDIFKDPDPSNIIFTNNIFKSTYYIDHDTLNYTLTEYKQYFFNNTQKIINTINKVKFKLYSNWLNIFPIGFKNNNIDYENEVYKNLKIRWEKKDFNYESDNILLGFDTLFGTISNFLYNDICTIKWMIYDYYRGDEIYPSIIHISELLNINNILNEEYDITSFNINNNNNIFYRLPIERQITLKKIWDNVILETKNINNLTNLLLFFLKKNIYKIDNYNISNECKLFFKNSRELKDDKEEIDKIEEKLYFEKNEGRNYIKEIIYNIEYADIYDYIFECMHQFRYTWYGFMCLTSKKVILDKISFKNYFKLFFYDEINKVKKIYENISEEFFSLKLFYNYFKSLIHTNVKIDNSEVYLKYGNTWDELHVNFKVFIESRLNEFDDEIIWFNIPNNLKRIPFMAALDEELISEYMKRIRYILFNVNFIPKIIMITLIYNGILTEFIYNPEITNKNELPDKNLDLMRYKNKIIEKIKIDDYKNYYNFLSNTIYSVIPNSCETIKNSFWYNNFGGDWVAQIQIYHHFINQRFMIITAVTGAGKSTVIPFILLYALKILNYNNNCKLVCTAPRIVPVIKNTKRISESLGYKYNEYIQFDDQTKKERKFIKKELITYIQFKHSKDNTTDDYYHPKLIFETDGALYQEIKDKYLFKVDIDKTYKNLFDIILIDEAHEHNTYMDLILTLARNNLYINNKITLGIVSATIDDDEPLYRKFFININDNLKYPLKLDEFKNKNNFLDSNHIDRRINIGAPFTGTNFIITEKFKKDVDEMLILKEIYNISNNKDILLFKSGISEIFEMIEKINNESPEHVYAIPFYKELDPKILENVQNMDENIRKNSFNYPKDKQITDLDDKDKVKPGTYTQFVIVATNIAEASITIDSLGFIIDDGLQKINYYDYNIRNNKLKKEKIANPNRIQRKGRIGRVQPGTIYYTYLSSEKDIKELNPKVKYKFCIENITTFIINLINNEEFIKKEINIDNDPSLVDNLKLPDYIKDQYIYITIGKEDRIKKFTYYYLVNKYINENNEKIFKTSFNKNNNIFYPYTNSKYNINDIFDDKSSFFIINPDDDLLIRDKNLNIINIKKINNINYFINFDSNNKSLPLKEYKNKIQTIINNLKEYLLLDDKYLLTNIGKIIQDIISEEIFQKIETVICILDIIKNYEFFDYSYIIFLIMFIEGLSFKLSDKLKKKYIDNKSDILNILKIFPKKILNKLLLYDINSYKYRNINLKDKLELINKEIEIKSKEIINNFITKNFINDEDIENLESIYVKFNQIKIRIEIYKDRFNLFDRYIIINNKNPDLLDDYEKEIVLRFKSEKTNIFYNKNFIEIKKNIEFNIFNDYEKMCFFAAKYYRTNIVINIPNTYFYLNYFYPNINLILQINDLKNKKSNINIIYKLKYIFYCYNNENIIDMITFIPTKILNKIVKDEKIKIIKDDTKINLDYIKNNYVNYKKILKKIDFFIYYIKNI